MSSRKNIIHVVGTGTIGERLIGRGAKLVVDEDSRPEFEALARAAVPVDCPPAS